jgi:hypothetical protein
MIKDAIHSTLEDYAEAYCAKISMLLRVSLMIVTTNPLLGPVRTSFALDALRSRSYS